MCLNAFYLGQLTSTVLGQVDYVDYDQPQSGRKRPKLTTPTNNALANSAIHKTINGYSEVLIWFIDGAFRGSHW